MFNNGNIEMSSLPATDVIELRVRVRFSPNQKITCKIIVKL